MLECKAARRDVRLLSSFRDRQCPKARGLEIVVEKGPLPPVVDPKAPVKDPPDKKVEPKDQPKDKIPFIVIAKEIKTWVNRDPEGNTLMVVEVR